MRCALCERLATIHITDVYERSQWNYCHRHAMESGELEGDPYAECLRVSAYSVKLLTSFVRIHQRRPTDVELANMKQDDERMDRVQAAADYIHNMVCAEQT